MAETTAYNSQTVEKTSELSPQKYWEAEITASKQENKKFYDRAEAANRRYLDERDTVDAAAKKFNIFYANTNILQSALYSQPPQPSVGRRYTDYRDNVGRVAALILERALGTDINDPSDTFDDTMRQAVQDRLIPGLGAAWLRLETETEDIPESEGGQITDDAQSTQPSDSDQGQPALPEQDPTYEDPLPPGLNIPLKKIKQQRVAVDYVYWKDFLWSPCRVYSERRWVARRVYMTRDQLVSRFGEEKGKACTLNYTAGQVSADRQPTNTTPTHMVMEQAEVYEIWDRVKRKVIWYSSGANDILDEKKDFLDLESFEPCPTPMFANLTTSNTSPRPDYYMIQDQYLELDSVNARISLLVSACKVIGVYASNSQAVKDMLKGAENTMIPVDNWGQFAEKQGLKGNIDWLPLDPIVNALQRLYEAREAIKGQIYELTGIADIVRGDSKASETLGAQQIKAQFASIRIKRLQGEVARFATDILRIKAEIMLKHFDIDILIRKSGIVYTDNDEFVPAAVALLKSEEGFQWRVKIQSDSMAQADYDGEKKDRIDFMSAISGYMANALPMTIQIPETKPIILGVLKWGIAAFKQASDIEGMIDKQLAAIEGKPPAPPPPDPKMAAVQAKIQSDNNKAQLDAASKQQDMQNERDKSAMELQMMDQKMRFDQAMADMDMKMKQFSLMMDGKAKEQDLAIEAQKGAQQMAHDHQQAQLSMANQQQEHALNMETQAATAQQTLKQGEQAHQQKQQHEKKSGALKLTLAKQAAAQKPAPAKTVH